MSSTTACFEIVHFAFRDDIHPTRQTELMELLGNWACTQAGFVARQSFHDRHANRWTDVVERASLQQAQAAMTQSQQVSALVAVMGAIRQESVLLGHYERII